MTLPSTCPLYLAYVERTFDASLYNSSSTTLRLTGWWPKVVPASYSDCHVSSQAFEARQTPVKLDDPDRWRKYLEARALPGLELSEITKPGGFLPSKVRNANGLEVWGSGVSFIAPVFVLRAGVFEVMEIACTG